jgi:hypothetical protein
MSDITEESKEDNAERARREYNANRGDHRKYLGSLFDKADETERQMTSAAKRTIDHSSESGSPFIKTAFNKAFSQSWFSKTASSTYREVVFRSFATELEKLASR